MKTVAIIWYCLGILASAGALKFEKSTIDADLGIKDESIVQDFKFTNSSSEAIKIRSADAGCSCMEVTIADGKLSYAPGESGVIRAVFDVGTFQGTVQKPIHIWLDGDPDEKPSASIMLRVHVPVIIAVEPKTLKWEVGEESATKTMDVKMNYEKPIHVTGISTSNENFETKLVAVEKGKHYQIQITPKVTDSPALSIVRINTDVDVKKQKLQQGFAVVKVPTKKP